jgi:YD repeat-containing protein
VSYTYDANGRRVSVTDGEGVKGDERQRTNDERGTNEGVAWAFVLGPSSVDDAAGNRTKVTEAEGSSTEWSYDSLDQLIREVKKDANLTVTYDVRYTYDAVGHRLTKVDHLTNTTTNYTYNKVNEMLTAGNATYTYDANGNLASKTENNRTTSYEWTLDHEGTKAEGNGRRANDER